MKKRMTILWLIILFIVQFISGQNLISIIPKPQEVEYYTGSFIISPTTLIVANNKLTMRAEQLRGYLSPAMGYSLPIQTKASHPNYIEMKLDPSLEILGKEAYQLEIYPNRIIISAHTDTGLFWAIQTIRQLLPQAILRQAPVKEMIWQLPCLKIKDKPRFKWRGLMLDCSRTFISKEQIKKYIEQMCFYKMNVLQLHLTDDQGWRIEIKKYPQLTSICSKFDSTCKEPKEYEGFYSQDDMKELVAFASERNIDIVPEIEMPGHSAELFAAFPDLSCFGHKLKVKPWAEEDGVHDEILCVGNDSTFIFIKNVIDELIPLFPSTYFHIGGDEAPKKAWKQCAKCQRKIKSELLNNENELQSWFIKKVEHYLNSKGKNLVGWDEILEGGISETATVMYWRDWQEVGNTISIIPNNIIMTPTSHCYFDYSYQDIPTQNVYNYNPAAKERVGNNTEKVIGVQANFWSHIDRTPPNIDRQLFPRLLAMSEIAWTNNDKKDWADFKNRLSEKLHCLDIMGIYYHSPN